MRALLLAVLLGVSMGAIAKPRCYVEKDPNKAVEIYYNVLDPKPRVAAYMYTENPFYGEYDHRINGYCQYVSGGVTAGFFKPNQVKTVPMSECVGQ